MLSDFRRNIAFSKVPSLRIGCPSNSNTLGGGGREVSVVHLWKYTEKNLLSVSL